ncbi:hypothetical protein BJ994_001122 [Arthrobacter pigmenti]|uniref:Uncharacterized protein n=1 Tax=Arthrobacter pigmenti TaxID=271432 RepID=A0A846RSJ8_9MICC|nr:hypothetical protein [Arthrobacter pigmenti]NJC22046.1 hypothetical protein [Arthrobacter pigmenti]
MHAGDSGAGRQHRIDEQMEKSSPRLVGDTRPLDQLTHLLAQQDQRRKLVPAAAHTVMRIGPASTWADRRTRPCQLAILG